MHLSKNKIFVLLALAALVFSMFSGCVKARGEAYTVIFVDEGKVLSTQRVLPGSDASFSTAKEGWVFLRWEPVPENVQKNMMVQAVWKEIEFPPPNDVEPPLPPNPLPPNPLPPVDTDPPPIEPPTPIEPPPPAFPPSADEPAAQLSFAVTDAISSANGEYLFISSYSEQKVYRVDTGDFSIKSLSFELKPESLAYSDGKLFVALCTQAHSSYWWTENQTGAFAVIDAESFAILRINSVGIDPYSIAVSDGGTVYIASGSGQWTSIHAYTQSGTLLNTSGARQATNIIYNPQYNRIYAVNTDITPRSIAAYNLDGEGKLSGERRWPYHGTYSLGMTIRIAADGQYLLNSSGNIVSCSDTNSEDMKYQTAIAKPWVDLAFNGSGDRFFAAAAASSGTGWQYPQSQKEIHAYGYPSFQYATVYETQGYPYRLFVKGDTLIVVSKETAGGNTFFIEIIGI